LKSMAQLRAHFVSAALVSAAIFLFASIVPAQVSGTISGSVTDSSGAPIFGAQVALASTAASAITDDRGQFQFRGTPVGTLTLTVRRLGFVPTSAGVSVSQEMPNARVVLRMSRTATVLAAVAIRTQRVDFTGRLAGYYQRLQRHSGGYFITREQIDRENPSRLTQLLAHVPGITANRVRGGGGGVRMRQRACWPLVWLDGMQMGAAETDLDAFPPSTLQGIELYLGSTTAPMRYQADRDQSSCGTILLWSRGPDTDPVFPPSSQGWDFEKMVQTLSIFTADQVDQSASPDSAQPIAVKYPPSLFAAGVGGTVLAEFVVDTEGRIEYESLDIVSSSHPLFSDAVRQALESARYKPAIRKGTAVRQLVQQPFDFSVAAGRSPGG
jgi:TonB family protein